MERAEFDKFFEGIDLPTEKIDAAWGGIEAALTDARSETTNRTLTEAEAIVQRLTGLAKDPNEKFTAYSERALTAKNEQAVAALKSEVAALTEKVKQAEAGKVPVAEVEALRAQLVAKAQEFEDFTKKSENEINTIRRESKINTAIAGLKFNPALAAEILEPFVNARKAELLNAKTAVEPSTQKEYLIDENGAPKFENNKLVYLEDYVAKLFGSVLAQQQTTGSGTPPNNPGNLDNKNNVNTSVDISKAKSQAEAADILYTHYSNLPESARAAHVARVAKTDAFKRLPKF